MQIKLLIFACFLLAGLVNCTGGNIGILYGTTPNTNPTKNYGLLAPITNFKGGVLIHSGDIPGQIGYGAESISTGTACSRSILNLVAFGDSSLSAAKAAGKISKIATVDYEQLAFLVGVYHSFCTVVTGSSASAASSLSAPSTTPVLEGALIPTNKRR